MHSSVTVHGIHLRLFHDILLSICRIGVAEVVFFNLSPLPRMDAFEDAPNKFA